MSSYYIRSGAVHFHDAYIPFERLPGILEDAVFFWGETALPQAFLERTGGAG